MAAKKLNGDTLLELAKQARAPRPLMLALFGVYGGQFAKLFDAPFNVVASVICLLSMALGVGLLTYLAIRDLLRARAR